MSQQPIQTFSDLLRRYRVDAKLTQSELAEAMGVSRTAIQYWESGKSTPNAAKAEQLCHFLKISLTLLLGLQNEAELSPENRQLLERFGLLSETGQRIIRRTIETILEEETHAHERFLLDTYQLALVEETAAAAGTGYDYAQAVCSYAFVRKDRAGSADAIVRVQGASMEPRYYDGDRVYVQRTQSCDPGDFVICRIASGLVIKQVGADRQLHSLNPAYPFPPLTEGDSVAIYGKVTGIVQEDDLADRKDRPLLEQLMEKEIGKFRKENFIYEG